VTRQADSTGSPRAIEDNAELLALMMRDAALQNELYRPGPYWSRKTRNTTDQIRRWGIGDFRGVSSTIGLSFTDCMHVDVRHNLTGGMRSLLRIFLKSVLPFNKVFDTQVTLTPLTRRRPAG
jgi:hypothetical protein